MVTLTKSDVLFLHDFVREIASDMVHNRIRHSTVLSPNEVLDKNPKHVLQKKGLFEWERTSDVQCYCGHKQNSHLDGIKGNFSVTEQEYVSAFSFHERGFSEWMIYSNFKEIVEHQQYIFESLWNTSTSAERNPRMISVLSEG